MQPERAGFVFTPASRTVTPATTGADFAVVTAFISGRVTAGGAGLAGANFTTTSSPPTISNIADLVIAKGATTGALRFDVGDVETRAGMLTVAGASSDPLLVPAAAFAFGGVGAERTVTITPAPARTGTATITITVTPAANFSGTATVTITVTDGASAPATSAFNVTVDAPPSIAAVANQTGFSSLAGTAIVLALTDVDSPITTLTVTAVSSDPTIVPPGGFAFTGTGNTRTLVITPAEKSEGLVTITLTISDGLVTSTTSFQLAVEPRPEFDCVELPGSGPGSFYPMAINDAGQIVGQSANNGTNRAVLWAVNGTPTITTLRYDVNSVATGINNAGDIAGATNTRGFLYRTGIFTTVGTTGGESSADDINESGIIVGEIKTPDSICILDDAAQTNLAGSFFVSLPVNGYLRINDRGDVSGKTPGNRLLVWQVTDAALGTRAVRDLGTLGGSGDLHVARLNNAGQIVATVNSAAVTAAPVIYNYVTNTPTSLGSLLAPLGTGGYVATGINDSGEVVGKGVSGLGGRPFLYSEGRAFDLAKLVPAMPFPGYGHAAAINARGDIVGSGQKPGSSEYTAFLLRRAAVDVGQPIRPPLRAVNPGTNLVFRPPAVEALDGTPPEEVAQAFLWSPVDQRAYFLRPISGRITWFTSADFLDSEAKIVRTIRSAWSANPQLHIVGAPTQLDPLDVASPYRAVAKSHSTVLNSTFDAGNAIHTSSLLRR